MYKEEKVTSQIQLIRHLKNFGIHRNYLLNPKYKQKGND